MNCWNTTEPPKDRPIVAIGKIRVVDEGLTAAIPFCDAVQWHHGDQVWVYCLEEFPQAVQTHVDDLVTIHFWTDYPKDAA